MRCVHIQPKGLYDGMCQEDIALESNAQRLDKIVDGLLRTDTINVAFYHNPF